MSSADRLDDPVFRAALVDALLLVERADDPATIALTPAHGRDWAQAKTDRILAYVWVLLQRRGAA